MPKTGTLEKKIRPIVCRVASVGGNVGEKQSLKSFDTSCHFQAVTYKQAEQKREHTRILCPLPNGRQRSVVDVEPTVVPRFFKSSFFPAKKILLRTED
jgi:hypothetical protein